MRATLLDAKHAREVVVLRFPFASEMPAGLSIASVQRVVSVKRGADANAAAICLGSAQIEAATHEVLQRVQAGLGSVTYGLLIAATLSDATTVLVRAVELPVVDF